MFRYPEAMEQNCKFPRHGNDRLLPGILSASFGQVETPSSERTILSEAAKDEVGAFRVEFGSVLLRSARRLHPACSNDSTGHPSRCQWSSLQPVPSWLTSSSRESPLVCSCLSLLRGTLLIPFIITDSRAEHAKFRAALRAGTGPLWRVAEDAKRLETGEECNSSLQSRKNQNFLDDLSNSGPAVRRYSEGRATGPPEDHYRRRQ